MEYFAKYWEGGRIELEPVCFAEAADGSITGGELLYAPGAIESVLSPDGTLAYEEGRDYLVEGKRLIRTPDSRMPLLARDIYCKPYDGTPERAWLRLPGGREILLIYPEAWRYQVLVTYTHDGCWEDFRPASGTDALKRTMEKLARGGEFRLAFYGDSITAGWEASGCDEEVIDVRTIEPFRLKIDRFPHLPAWPSIVTEGLRRAYPQTEILKINRGAGGSTTRWGVEHCEELVCPFRPDLLVLAFGMNGPCDPPEQYRAAIEEILRKVRAASPNCEVILVSPMVPSDELAAYQGNTLAGMEDALRAIAGTSEGIAVAPVHSVFEAIRRFGKSYYEITGNCINHPNDFSVRAYAQTILSVFGI